MAPKKVDKSKHGSDPLDQDPKTPVQENPPVIEFPSRYCGRVLTRNSISSCNKSNMNWLAAKGYPGRPTICCPIGIFDPDNSCPKTEIPVDPPPVGKPCAFKHPCVDYWAQSRAYEAQAQPTADENLTAVTSDNTEVIKDANQLDIVEIAVKDARTEVSEKDVTDKDARKKVTDKDVSECIPYRNTLVALFGFNDEDLDELLEAFYYFARPLLPEQAKKKEEAKPDDTSATESKTTGGKGKKDKSSTKADKGATKKDQKSSKDKVEETPAETSSDPPVEPILGLDLCAFANCLRSIGQNPTECDLGIMFSLAGPTPITLTSFLYAVDSYYKMKCDAEMENDLIEAFRVFDEEGFGRIKVDVLREALKQNGEPLYNDDLEELLTLGGEPDSLGYVDLEQIVHVLVKAKVKPKPDVPLDNAAESEEKTEQIPVDEKKDKKADGKSKK